MGRKKPDDKGNTHKNRYARRRKARKRKPTIPQAVEIKRQEGLKRRRKARKERLAAARKDERDTNDTPT
jgi:hypothetical protein